MGLANLLRAGPVTLDTPLPAGTFAFRSLNGQERLGQPFVYRLEVTSQLSHLTGADLIGEPVAVHLELEMGEQRDIHALVTDVENAGTYNRHARYFLTLRPWLWLLTQVRNCRIFQGKNVPDIVKSIFRDRGLTDFEEHLFETYTPREMVVQYCESDFNFVSRLLEEEGIYYYFRHEAGKHLVVLSDSQSSHARDPMCKTLPYYAPDEAQVGFRQGVDLWAPVEHFKPDQFAMKTYDFKHPKADLNAQRQHNTFPATSGFEIFEYPGGHLTKSQGEDYARVRLEELQSTVRFISARTNAPGLLVGRLFELTDHPQANENAEYLVVGGTISVRAPELESGQVDTGVDYECEFEAINSSTPFRPRRIAPKPFVRGPQTATVVTSGSEDIWTDEYARIRVKFDWDRFGATDENASAWVRVAQLWSGPAWGAQFIPRVNMEVVVNFLEGDPDRPLVTGCVYNADNTPPYTLPANQTQSGVKTRSSKGGTPDNFNEIRFEDLKGKEELHLQAEKDMSTLVKNDQSTSIGHDRTTTIKRNDTLNITGDQFLHIHGNLSMTVDGVTDSKNPDPSSKIKSSMSVTGQHKMHASDTIDMDAPNHISLTCGGSSILIEPGKITITAGGKALIVLDAHVLAQSSDKSEIVLDANALMMASGKAQVLLDANVLAQSSGGTNVVLDGDATVHSPGDVKIDGTNVTAIGKTKVAATGGAGNVELAAGGATMSGPKVTVSGSGVTEITGGIVKIN